MVFGLCTVELTDKCLKQHNTSLGVFYIRRDVSSYLVDHLRARFSTTFYHVLDYSLVLRALRVNFASSVVLIGRHWRPGFWYLEVCHQNSTTRIIIITRRRRRNHHQRPRFLAKLPTNESTGNEAAHQEALRTDMDKIAILWHTSLVSFGDIKSFITFSVQVAPPRHARTAVYTPCTKPFTSMSQDKFGLPVTPCGHTYGVPPKCRSLPVTRHVGDVVDTKACLPRCVRAEFGR